MSEKTLGQVAFEKYNECRGGKTYDGKPTPPWDSLTDDVGLSVRNAWEEAARAGAYEMIQRWGVATWIDGAAGRLAKEPPGREASLVKTKLDEAEMWDQRRVADGAVPGTARVGA